MGTVAYMSPEQARSEELDRRTDIFSLGAVLHEMATGKLAFPGNTTAVMFKQILDAPPIPPTRSNPAMSERFDEIVGKTLEKDRDLRYQSAADVRADLCRLKRDSASGFSEPAQKGQPESGLKLLLESFASGRTRLACAFVGIALLTLLGWWEWKRTGTKNIQPVQRQLTARTVDDSINSAVISRDGRYLAYSDKKGFRSKESKTRRPINCRVPRDCRSKTGIRMACAC
jgi:serine/threonine protein kinase